MLNNNVNPYYDVSCSCNSNRCKSYSSTSKNTCVVKGYITYNDGCPVANAILILEPLENIYKNLMQITTTNDFGEYCFLVTNTNIYYKVKIFNNDDTCGSNYKIVCE